MLAIANRLNYTLNFTESVERNHTQALETVQVLLGKGTPTSLILIENDGKHVDN